MNYVYDTTILSIAPPQRGRANIELPSPPPILTSDGRELILSQCFLQWLYPDQTTTSLYTSVLRPHSDDIIIKNVGGQEIPFVLLPPGVVPPTVDVPTDPYLTLVSLAVRRALAPPPSMPQPAPQPVSYPAAPRIEFTSFIMTPSKMWAMSQDRYAPPPYAPRAYAPANAHAAPLTSAFTSTTNNIQNYLRGSAPALPYASRRTILHQMHENFDFLTDTGQQRVVECSSNDGCYTLKPKESLATWKMPDALGRLPWALAAAGLGIVLAVVF